MIPFFLRSLASTMSRRFPITAAGDPHAPSTTHIYVHSVISLLTLPPPALTPAPAPLEHLNLRSTYAEYLQATHIVPLQVLQALLPLLRASPARSRDARANGLGKQSIVVCLPATDARVGLPFAGAQAMSAAATLRGVEVLRREIRASSASGSSTSTETADAMRNIKVTVVDVGAVGEVTDGNGARGSGVGDSEWTPGEKAAYGAAFGALLEHRGIRRRPSDVAAFVDTVVDVVSNGKKSQRGLSLVAIRLGLGRLRELIRGDRVVGAGGASLVHGWACSFVFADICGCGCGCGRCSGDVRGGVAAPGDRARCDPEPPVLAHLHPQRAPPHCPARHRSRPSLAACPGSRASASACCGRGHFQF